MEIIDTELKDVKVIKPKVFGDERGYFFESFRQNWFEESVAPVKFVQDNQSRSELGVLRGLHYQMEKTQGKLVRVIKGEVFDVAVDMRKNSPDFGKWTGVCLSESNGYQMWVPAGFAHGFLVTSEYAEFVYKCTDYYHPQSEVSIVYNDPDLAIEWPGHINESAMSEKDKKGLFFKDAPVFE